MPFIRGAGTGAVATCAWLWLRWVFCGASRPKKPSAKTPEKKCGRCGSSRVGTFCAGCGWPREFAIHLEGGNGTAPAGGNPASSPAPPPAKPLYQPIIISHSPFVPIGDFVGRPSDNAYMDAVQKIPARDAKFEPAAGVTTEEIFCGACKKWSLASAWKQADVFCEDCEDDHDGIVCPECGSGHSYQHGQIQSKKSAEAKPVWGEVDRFMPPVKKRPHVMPDPNGPEGVTLPGVPHPRSTTPP